jgi:hypothetical protein
MVATGADARVRVDKANLRADGIPTVAWRLRALQVFERDVVVGLAGIEPASSSPPVLPGAFSLGYRS